MIKIEKPNYTALQVYDIVSQGLEDSGLNGRMRAAGRYLERQFDLYESAASKGDLHLISPHTDVCGLVSKDEMAWLYKYRFVQHERGREIYNDIKSGAPGDICPLCGEGVVSTLDHYLPKSKYSSFTVHPMNLVPACQDCNKAKLAANARSPEKQSLHPYYDGFINEQWLFARVIPMKPLAVKFFAAPPKSYRDIESERIKHHFASFGLARLFSVKAGQQLANDRGLLVKKFRRYGEHGVREHLKDLLESCAEHSINSWKHAMYLALETDEWFYSEGFMNIAAPVRQAVEKIE